MIPFIRSSYFFPERDLVEILVEVHPDEASFLDPQSRPDMQDYLHTTETALIAAMAVPGENWGNRELQLVGESLRLEHRSFKTLGESLRLAPPIPDES